MDIIRFAIRNPVTVSVGVVLILLFGLLSLTAIPIQLTPNVDRPVVSVSTRWEGASPEEVESDIIRPQEEKLKTVEGLEKMTSTSQLAEGQVLLEFPTGTDKDAAFQEVTEKLRQVPSYPADVDEPVVEASDPRNRDYIAWMLLYSTDEDFNVRTLKKFAEDRIKPRLERVNGVSEILVFGGAEDEMHVKVDPLRLAQYHIPPTKLEAKLRSQNLNVSAGAIAEGKYDVLVRTVGRFEQPEQIADLVISDPGEPVVRVHDVADVEPGYKELFGIVRSKGQDVLAIPAQREVGSNVIAVMEGLKEAVREVNDRILPLEAERLGIEGELVLEQVYDQTIYIHQALALVRNNLFVGGTLAVLVLLVFLRSIRATLIVALAIPISVIGTFVAMVAMGRNINVISLAGLAFAVGLVVDNAIVVLENIDRHRKLGERAAIAAYRATKEVWGAIVASTLTTLAVFLPVIFMQEEAGQLFKDIALAVCAAVTLSLIVSVLVIPTAASRFLRDHKTGDPSPDAPRRAWSGAMAAPQSVVDGLTRMIHWLTGSWVLRPVIVVGFVIGTLLASAALMPPTSYLPQGNRNLVFALLFPPPGYNTDYFEHIGKRVDRVLAPYWSVEPTEEGAKKLEPVRSLNPWTGERTMLEPAPIDNFFFVGLSNGLMFMGATSAFDDRVDPIEALLNNVAGMQPGVIGFAQQQPLFRSGGSAAGEGIQIEISGPELSEVTKVAEALFGQAMARDWQATPDPGNFNLPRHEVQVVIDPVLASDLNITNTDLATAVRMLGDGAIVGEYFIGGDSIDLKMINNFDDYEDATFMADIPIATPSGRIVPLASVADIRRTTAPQQINRIEEQRSVSINISVSEELPLEVAMNTIENEMIQPMRERGVIPPSIETNVAGTAAKLREVKTALLGEWTGLNLHSLQSLFTSRAFLAVLVTFLLMAALFESWLYPVVIMVSVPLATVGGFLGLATVHTIQPEQQLDVVTMLGFIILTGIVVNNAILLVHQALNFMRGMAESQVEGKAEKLSPREAIAESVRTRTRPIVMSTMTSVGGMLPLVVFPGSGSELYRGLGSVVVGGLIVASLFTLILVPLLMSLVLDARRLLFGGEAIHADVLADLE